MTVKKTKAVRIAATRAPSANAQAASLLVVSATAYDIGHKGLEGQRSCDAAISAALKGCDSPERRKAIGETFKLGFAAAILSTCSENLPMDARIAYAEKLKAMAPGPVKNPDGTITAPTGKLKEDQKRRSLEQQTDWSRAYAVNAAKFLSRSLDRLGLVATNPVGAKGGATKKAANDEAKAKEETGATIALAKVAPFMPPARKDMTPQKLAAYLVNQGAVMVAAIETAVQAFDKSGTQTAGLLAMSTAATDYREAINKAAVNFK